MRNSNYIRMFEDEDCTDAERELLAAVMGKSVAECKTDWSRQFKIDLVMSNDATITRQFSSKSEVTIKIALTRLDERLIACLSKCNSGVVCDTIDINIPSTVVNEYTISFDIPTWKYVTFTLLKDELSDDELNMICAKMMRQYV